MPASLSSLARRVSPWRALVAVLVLAAGLAPALAQQGSGAAPGAPAIERDGRAAPALRVATRVLPPFVVETQGALSGFSVELWEALARELGLETRWVTTPDVRAILAAVETGAADIAIAAISVTAEREQRFDFSQPMFESGLQILVRADGAGGLGMAQILAIMTSGAMPYLLLTLLLLVLVPAHVAWWSDRRHADGLFSPAYIPGIFQAIGWGTGAALGQQYDRPRSGLGRFVSVLSIVVSVVFVTYLGASLTSAMTLQQLKGEIEGVDDLPGKRVGTTVGSTAAAHLRGMGLPPVEFSRIEEAFDALERRRIDAVVFDAPVLLYHAATAGKGRVRVVGQVFRKENYAILFPRDSALRKRVNEALLTLRENGAYDRIYLRWFSAVAARPD